jgi:uncharacterized protein
MPTTPSTGKPSTHPPSAPRTPTSTRPGLLVRVTAVMAAVTLVWLLTGRGLSLLLGEDYSRLAHLVRAVLTCALAVPVVALARRHLDRRPWSGLGLQPLRTGWRPLLLGMAAWLVPAALGVAVCVAAGWTQVTLRTSVWEAAATAAMLVVLVFLYEALPEELVFRGYLYRNLADTLPRWAAALGQAGLFTLFGVAIGAAGSIDRVVLFGLFAAVLGYLRALTGSVWTGIGFHLAFQVVAQLTGPNHGQFTITDLLTFQGVSFVLLPFTLGALLVRAARRGRTGWLPPIPTR